jgi:hypothetical protein
MIFIFDLVLTMKMESKRYTRAINECIRDRIASFKTVDWNALSSNPNITFDIVKENINEQWDWYELSRNPNMTCDIVKENIDKPWNWSYLCLNPNIIFEFVKETMDKPWN